MYALTIFKSQFDNKTHRTLELSDWNAFGDLLHSLHQLHRKTKKDAELISPAIYEEGTTRSNKNVTKWASWCAVDVDDYGDAHVGEINASIQKYCGDYQFICYSTASSTPLAPKFRLVFNLNREVEADEIRHFWYALNQEIGELGDPQTKDLSRMYYVPAQYENAFNFIFANPGRPVDVDELKAKHPYTEKTGNSFIDRLPPDLQEAVLEHRKSQLNAKFMWTGISDCPFWPKTLASEYQSITETGWYHKMYQIMVSVACNAIKRGYPITAKEIATLCRELDNATGNWYSNRPLEVEADRAVEYAYRNN